ncbi:MAG: TIGR01212 family radical SAM protein [Candidatus Cloacimonadota bacterium]|nr:MAG: TIGR01212 family radical SAM protein [Candidatus Cloacimonadota bacterium]PIE78839.1 MAG: TIGR01212 family radical SAM protein [Candidatus Delongbacteria bacterium]
MSHYYSYKDYMKTRYGEPLYRVPVDFNSGCPNRREDGSGGCSFCSLKGSRSVQTLSVDSVEDQIREGISFVKRRYGAKKIMLYFQAYTSYFTPKWQTKYEDLFRRFEFDALSIGTRPDCLDNSAIDYLEGLSKRYDLLIELGVQTSNNKTLDRINRGHSYEDSREAIINLSNRNIDVAIHLILGLPRESFEDYLQTVKDYAKLPISGIKFHNLHIVKNSQLAIEYEEDRFPLLYEHQYCEYLCNLIRYIPSNIPIMRISTDSEESDLIAPKWHMKKDQFKNYFERSLILSNYRQGDLANNRGEALPSSEGFIPNIEDLKKNYDLSIDVYENFIKPSNLESRIEIGDLKILDIGFGAGYKILEAIELVKNSKNSLSITALEKDRRVVLSSSKYMEYPNHSFNNSLLELYNNSRSKYKGSDISIYFGDLRYSLTKLNCDYDIVFLDSSSKPKNLEALTVDFFRELKNIIKDNSVVVTIDSSLPVINGFIKAGFFVVQIFNSFLKKRGVIAYLDRSNILSNQSLENKKQLSKRRDLEYRDPFFIWSSKEILRDREERLL